MEAFLGYHFLIIEIVGFDNFKCIPCCCFPHNIRPLFVYLAKVPKHGRGIIYASVAKCVQSP
jgi:hypothetical protein